MPPAKGGIVSKTIKFRIMQNSQTKGGPTDMNKPPVESIRFAEPLRPI